MFIGSTTGIYSSLVCKKNVTITLNTTGFDLYQHVINTTPQWNGFETIKLNVTVNPDVTISAASPSTVAFAVSGFDSGRSIINLTNNGNIFGRFNTNTSIENGQGGTALLLEADVNLYNNGKIYAGSGIASTSYTGQTVALASTNNNQTKTYQISALPAQYSDGKFLSGGYIAVGGGGGGSTGGGTVTAKIGSYTATCGTRKGCAVVATELLYDTITDTLTGNIRTRVYSEPSSGGSNSTSAMNTAITQALTSPIVAANVNITNLQAYIKTTQGAPSTNTSVGVIRLVTKSQTIPSGGIGYWVQGISNINSGSTGTSVPFVSGKFI